MATTSNNKIILRVSGDIWQGTPQFTVWADGRQLGGVYSTTASYASGEWEDVVVQGAFGPVNPEHVTIRFVNDAWGGTAETDRNLYVDSLTIGNSVYQAQTSASGGTMVGPAAALFSNGDITFDTGNAQKNTLVVRVSADAWNGAAQFSVTVDGKQIGGIFSTSASHADGQWQDIAITGSFSATPETVAVNFLNDAWGGTTDTDRNLYVDSLTIGGRTYQAEAAANHAGVNTAAFAALNSNGALIFYPGRTSTTVVLRVAADSWQGDPQFIVKIDGVQIGGVQTASAVHAKGQWQDITLTGDLANADPQTLEIQFINDGWGGTAETDRNLYVDRVTVNGTIFQGEAATGADALTSDAAALYSNGTLKLDLATVHNAFGVSPEAAPPAVELPPPTLALSAAGENASSGTPITNAGTTLLRGTAAAGSTVLLVEGTGVLASAVADASGAFTIAASGLAEGPHTLVATLAGASALSSAPVTLVVDRTAPDAPRGLGLSAASDSGVVGDGITNKTTVSIHGTAEAGAIVAITDNGAELGFVIADGGGDFVFSAGFTEGSHDIAAKATDAAGNTSQFSATLPFIVDDTAPLAPTGLHLDAASDSGIAGDNITTSHILTVLGTAERNSTVRLYDGGKIIGTGIADAHGSFAVRSDALSDGIHTITAQAVDAAGNVGAASGPLVIDIDPHAPAPKAGMALIGVNLAGGDFAADKLPGVIGRDYTYPTHGEIDYYANAGMNVIRLPFLWERLQHTMNGPLDQKELRYVDDIVHYAATKGMSVVLDLHNFGSGFGAAIGSSATPNSAFADFWGKLAAHFHADSNVIFGLMNEPHEQSAAAWATSANAAIAAIRDAGAHTQEILVPGTYWDGAWTWVSSDNDTALASAIHDPDHNYAFEVHQYLDYDGSGTHSSVVSAQIGVQRLQDITHWAEATGNKLFLGEFGVADDPQSLQALDKMLGYMDAHADVWQGATYWAGGPWWGDYMYSIEPINGHDRPQMDILQHYL